MEKEFSLTEKQFETLVEKMAGVMKEDIKEEAEKIITEKASDNNLSKKSFMTGCDAVAVEKENRPYQFFKALFTGDYLKAKALSESTNSAGGYLVPEGFRSEVVKRLPEIAELAPYVRSVPVITDTGSLPALATDISVTWRSASSSENTSFGESSPTLGSVAWALKRADAFTKISRELVADSAPAVVEFITGLFREAIASERDRVIAVGDGTTEPEGLSVASGISAEAIDANISFSGLVTIEQGLKKKYRKNARWIMNGTNLQRIYSLTDSQGQPIFMRNVIGGMPESRILGYPVSQQDDLADGTIIFGDLSYYLWFDRGEMGIESTNEGGDAFANHQTWIKVWERVDGKVGLDEAFIKGTGITG